MSGFIPGLLGMSLRGAALIAALLVFRRLFKGRVAPTATYALWLLPALRLLIPGSISCAFLREASSGKADFMAGGEVLPGLHGVLAEAVPEAAAAVSAGEGWDTAYICIFIWAAGALAVLLAAAWKNAAFCRRVCRDAVAVKADCPIPVYLGEGLAAPCLCGIFHPAVYLCDGVLASERRLGMALRHEICHYYSGDRFWGLLRLACCAVHWFNPLVWVAAAVSVEDCERACDFRVLKEAGPDEREAYGMLLVSCLKGAMGGYVLFTGSGMGFGKRALRERMALIASMPEYSRGAAVFLAACAAAACLAACASGTDGFDNMAGMAEVQTEWVTVSEMEGGSGLGKISGETFAGYLSTRVWQEAEAGELEGRDFTGRLELKAGCQDMDSLWALQFVSDKETAECYAVFMEKGAVKSCYKAPERDIYTVWAMTCIDKENTLRSDLPGGRQIAMVCSEPSLGMQLHFFFKTEDGVSYTPLESDLDIQHPRVAEGMLFIDEDTGFVSFRFERLDTAPELYRTADGGKSWEPVLLPMGDITVEGGYTGIHVTGMEFEDEANGIFTVSMTRDGREDSLSCRFVTHDAGRTFKAVT